jgi:hypothetical protein
MTVRITHIGGPTALIEVGEWRLLTGPAIAATNLGLIDAVLVSHDHHGDNSTPPAGPCSRRLAPSSPPIPGAGRLGGNARGLRPWATTLLEAPGRPTIQVTATPAATAHR